MPLIKVKISESDICKHERNTCKSEGAQNRQLENVTKIKLQWEPNARDFQ